MEFQTEWDLTTIPKELLYKESQRRMASAPRPGRRVEKPCKYCGDIMGVRALNQHQGTCSKNPRVQKILETYLPTEPESLA